MYPVVETSWKLLSLQLLWICKFILKSKSKLNSHTKYIVWNWLGKTMKSIGQLEIWKWLIIDDIRVFLLIFLPVMVVLLVLRLLLLKDTYRRIWNEYFDDYNFKNMFLSMYRERRQTLFSCSVMSDSCDLMGYRSLPGSFVRGILQARILERIAISFSRGYFGFRDLILSPGMAGRFFTTKPPGKPNAKRVKC